MSPGHSPWVGPDYQMIRVHVINPVRQRRSDGAEVTAYARLRGGGLARVTLAGGYGRAPDAFEGLTGLWES